MTGSAGTGSARRRVLIVSHQTDGLQHDAMVFARVLQAVLGAVEICHWRLTLAQYCQESVALRSELRALLPFDLVVFLEHLAPCAELYDRRHAHRCVYIPNPEWILPQDEAALPRCRLDAVLFKTPLTQRIFQDLPGTSHIPVQAVTGWTSLDRGADSTPDYGTFFHLRGGSLQKQTDVLVRTWIENPDLPLLTIVEGSRHALFPVPAVLPDNLRLVSQRLAEEELHRMQRRSGVHVCPSLVEGFGHSINEARAGAAVVITTDGPPMADFVDPEISGLLVPVAAEDIGRWRRSPTFPVRPDAVAATVRRLLAMSPDARQRMGAAARRRYVADRQAFVRRIAELFGQDGRLSPDAR